MNSDHSIIITEEAFNSPSNNLTVILVQRIRITVQRNCHSLFTARIINQDEVGAVFGNLHALGKVPIVQRVIIIQDFHIIIFLNTGCKIHLLPNFKRHQVSGKLISIHPLVKLSHIRASLIKISAFGNLLNLFVSIILKHVHHCFFHFLHIHRFNNLVDIDGRYCNALTLQHVRNIFSVIPDIHHCFRGCRRIPQIAVPFDIDRSLRCQRAVFIRAIVEVMIPEVIIFFTNTMQAELHIREGFRHGNHIVCILVPLRVILRVESRRIITISAVIEDEIHCLVFMNVLLQTRELFFILHMQNFKTIHRVITHNYAPLISMLMKHNVSPVQRPAFAA
nr:MAG TPA: hypothetical protein [Caudoviricetes sp.]